MSSTAAVAKSIRIGIQSGWIEARQAFGNVQDVIGMLFLPVVLLGVTVFLKDSSVGGTQLSLATNTLPGIIGLMLAFSGIQGLAFTILMEREDGTLLRAKTAPHGMLAYLAAKIVQTATASTVTLIVILVPGSFLFDGFQLGRPFSWVWLLVVVTLGLLATMPLGAMIGALLSNPRNIGVLMFPLIAIMGISGVFFPLSSAPGWLQPIAQVFPIYWIALGMRAALLPDDMVTVEIAQSWRHLETVGVLGAWAVVSLLVAPVVLRRMAQRESGSAMASRRVQAMQ